MATSPSVAWSAQSSRLLLPAAPWEGYLPQPGWRHLLACSSIIPSPARLEQNSTFLEPGAPYDACFPHPRMRAHPVANVHHPGPLVGSAELCLLGAGCAERGLLGARGMGALLDVGDVHHSTRCVAGAVLRVPPAELPGLAVGGLRLAARVAVPLERNQEIKDGTYPHYQRRDSVWAQTVFHALTMYCGSGRERKTPAY